MLLSRNHIPKNVCSTPHILVEMRGIEPRSDSNATGLLRVQFAKEFLSLSVSRKLGRLEQAQSTKSPLIPIDKELKQWLSK